MSYLREKCKIRKFCLWSPEGSPLFVLFICFSTTLHAPELAPALPVSILEGKAKDDLQILYFLEDRSQVLVNSQMEKADMTVQQVQMADWSPVTHSGALAPQVRPRGIYLTSISLMEDVYNNTTYFTNTICYKD